MVDGAVISSGFSGVLSFSFASSCFSGFSSAALSPWAPTTQQSQVSRLHRPAKNVGGKNNFLKHLKLNSCPGLDSKVTYINYQNGYIGNLGHFVFC